MSVAGNPDIWPTELRLNAGKDVLSVAFDNGESYELPAEFLRVTSPSAEVQGHSPEERRTVPGKRDVKIKALVPSGNYAVQIEFSDGHDTGLFTWGYLLELGRNQEAKWAEYLSELAAKGLTRG